MMLKRTRREEAELVVTIRVAAMKMASDADICAISGLSPDELTLYRDLIDRTRAGALASLKFQRARAQAARIKRGAND